MESSIDTSRYQIIRKIGEGGGGAVYLATDSHLQKQVVVKRIKGDVSVLKSRTEVDILKNLRHSYIPQVIDFIENTDNSYSGLDPGIYTVMDYIPGKSLQQMLDENHRFTEKQAVKYASQVCEALAYLHRLTPPIIHGDIKPDNIMITPEDNVCLIDFNISGFLEGRGIETTGYSPGFASPEQIRAFNYAQAQYSISHSYSTDSSYNGDTSTVMSGSYAGDTSTVMSGYYTGDTSTVIAGPQTGETSAAGSTYTGDTVTVLNSACHVNTIAAGGRPGRVSRGRADDSRTDDNVRIDMRSDIYSVGATVYTLLTGKFADPEAKKLKIGDSVSDGLRIILSKALEKDPQKRYQNATEMLAALNRVHEMDRSYRRLLIRQRIAVFIAFLIAVAGGALISLGGDRIDSEREGYYAEYVAQLKQATDMNLRAEEVDELFNGAISIHDGYLDPYYAKAYYMYTAARAGDDPAAEESVTAFLSATADRLLSGEDSMFSNLYYMFGDCLFLSGDYETACDKYGIALDYDDSNFAIYRDYAISLIYTDRLDIAERILKMAEERGVTQEDIYLVRGELERSYGNYREAADYFYHVLETADDEYMLERAYVMADKCFTAIGSVEALEEDIGFLRTADTRLSMNNRVLVYQSLAQALISLGEVTEDNTYYAEACETFKTTIEMNWGTYQTYSNLIVLNQRMNDYPTALAWADKMCERYPDVYISFMRRAFVEIELQALKDEGDREYSVFFENYEKAKEKYARFNTNNQTDSEMLLLENTYQQLKDGNWID